MKTILPNSNAERLGVAAPAPCSASVALESNWFRYLRETGNFDSYQSTCECWKCKEIKAGFAAWERKVAVEKIIESNFTGVIKGRRIELIMDTTDEAQELFDALVKLRKQNDEVCQPRS